MYERINHPGIIFPSKFATARVLPKVPRKDLSKWGYETMEIARITGTRVIVTVNGTKRTRLIFKKAEIEPLTQTKQQ